MGIDDGWQPGGMKRTILESGEALMVGPKEFPNAIDARDAEIERLRTELEAVRARLAAVDAAVGVHSSVAFYDYCDNNPPPANFDDGYDYAMDAVIAAMEGKQ